MKRPYVIKIILSALILIGLGVLVFLLVPAKKNDVQAGKKSVALEENKPANDVQSHDKKQKKTICLSMIVKNESHVITRCLATVKPIIDYWIVVDTGSKDGTQKIVQDYLKDIPGELYEHPWVNFEHNRNQALEYTKGKADYALFIDADEVFEYAPDFKLPELDKDSYLFTLVRGNVQYALPTLVRTDQEWKWHGALHEYLASPYAKTVGKIDGVLRTSTGDGSRSKDPQKYEKDVKVLRDALEKDPNNERHMFYLAQSYRDCMDFENSIETYRKRVAMGGWDQEVFYSLWQIAKMQDYLNKDKDTVVAAYTQAFVYRPTRAEPLNDLTKYYLRQKDFEKAYQVASIGRTIPRPGDLLFVEKTVYDFDMELQYSVAAYWVGKTDECRQACLNLLAKPELPEVVKKLVENNLAFANSKQVEQITK